MPNAIPIPILILIPFFFFNTKFGSDTDFDIDVIPIPFFQLETSSSMPVPISKIPIFIPIQMKKIELGISGAYHDGRRHPLVDRRQKHATARPAYSSDR